MFGDERDELGAAGGLLFVAADDVDHVVREQLAEFVEGREFAAVLVAGIDGQHASARQRRLEQEIAQIAGEHLDRMRFGFFSELATGLAFKAGQNQTREGVADAAHEKIFVGVVGRHQLLDAELLDRRVIGFDLHAEHLGTFAAIDRQYAVGRNPAERFAEIEVVVELLVLFWILFDLGANEFACFAVELADLLADLGVFTELLGQDVTGAEEGRGGVGNAFVGIDEVCGAVRRDRRPPYLAERISWASGARPCS